MDTATNSPGTDMTTANPAYQARCHGGFGTPLPRWVRIFVASVMLTTAAAAVVTHDLLVRWDAQTRLQIEATRMAIAGAVFLPGAPESAALAAAHSAELSGLGRSEVVHAGAAPNHMSFSVRLKRTVPVLILRLLGSTGTTVAAQATATVHPYASPRQVGGPMVLSALRPPATRFNACLAASSRTAVL